MAKGTKGAKGGAVTVATAWGNNEAEIISGTEV